MLVWLMLAAAAGCGSSLGSGPDSGAGGHGGSGGTSGPPSCAQAPRIDCATVSPPTPATLCTLGEGIAYACGLCGRDAGTSCGIDGALVHGANYTYIQIFNVDVWWISVYDQNGILVAQLEASVHGQAAGQPWACVAGPADFDASEAISLLPVVGEGELPGHCGADAGTSGASCSRPLGDDCSPSPLQSTANICTLDGGIGFACNPCGRDGGAQNCDFQSAMVRGAQYTYIHILNVDGAFIYVYDQNNKLIAKLDWSANAAGIGQPWSCAAGPVDFDLTEAKSLLPARSSELLCAR